MRVNLSGDDRGRLDGPIQIQLVLLTALLVAATIMIDHFVGLF